MAVLEPRISTRREKRQLLKQQLQCKRASAPEMRKLWTVPAKGPVLAAQLVCFWSLSCRSSVTRNPQCLTQALNCGVCMCGSVGGLLPSDVIWVSNRGDGDFIFHWQGRPLFFLRVQQVCLPHSAKSWGRPFFFSLLESSLSWFFVVFLCSHILFCTGLGRFLALILSSSPASPHRIFAVVSISKHPDFLYIQSLPHPNHT